MAVLQTTGLVTIEGLQWVIRDAARRLAGQKFGAIVSDYRRATLAVTDAELRDLLSPTDTPMVALMPAAIVIDGSCLHLVRGYAQVVAERGLLRRVVTCYETGFAWALSQAAMSAHRRPASGPRAGHQPSLAGQTP